MKKIKVVDAMMGRGKTSAAIEYMKTSPDRRFLFVTPYLDEVDKICKLCEFDQPESDYHTKLAMLKKLMTKHKRIATTHSLLLHADYELISLATENHYCIIIDESIDVIQKVSCSSCDVKVITEYCASVDEKTRAVTWKDPCYSGVYSEYKEMADAGSLYVSGNSFISMMNPEVLDAFDEIIMLTYMFEGQIQKSYFDFFGFEYDICGVDTSNGFRFTEAPDHAPEVDFSSLIHIVEDRGLNEIGRDRTALSASWFNTRSRDNPDIRQLRSNMDRMFKNAKPAVPVERQLWTTYKSSMPKLLGYKGRYTSCFLPMNTRATNNHRNRDVICYLVNRFVDPNYKVFFEYHGIKFNNDKFALSEMLQFIWRSAIRDGKPITVYIPSRRMRDLLKQWIDENSTKDGGEVNG